MDKPSMKMIENLEQCSLYYDSNFVTEIDEDKIYLETGEEYSWSEIDVDFLFAYKADEMEINWDLRSLSTMLTECKKELDKFEHGKNFKCLMVNGYILANEELEEMFDFDVFDQKSRGLQLFSMKKIKIKG